MNGFLSTFNITYKNKVRSKSFLTITIILMALVILFFNANKLKNILVSDDLLGVVADKNTFQIVEDNISSNIEVNRFERAKDAISELEKGTLDTIVEIQIDKEKINAIYYRKDTQDALYIGEIESILNKLQAEKNLKQLNLNDSELSILENQVSFERKNINANEDNILSLKEENFNFLFTYILLIVMIFIIINYMNQIAMEISVEKTSRVIEMIITSIKPSVHVFAKITAILCVALTQIIFVVFTVFLCILFTDSTLMFESLDITVTSANVHVIYLGILFWIIGLFSYTVLAAILGSLTSRIEDITQALMPLSIILLGSFYIVLFNLEDLNNKIVTITSFVPLFSPFSMLARISANSADNLEILISIVISIIFIIASLFIATVSYKSSVLNFESNIWKNFKKPLKKN